MVAVLFLLQQEAWWQTHTNRWGDSFPLVPLPISCGCQKSLDKGLWLCHKEQQEWTAHPCGIGGGNEMWAQLLATVVRWSWIWGPTNKKGCTCPPNPRPATPSPMTSPLRVFLAENSNASLEHGGRFSLLLDSSSLLLLFVDVFSSLLEYKLPVSVWIWNIPPNSC